MVKASKEVLSIGDFKYDENTGETDFPARNNRRAKTGLLPMA